jgi:hypothetical protein
MSWNSDDYKAAAVKTEGAIAGYVKTHVTFSLCVACLTIGVIIGKFFL